MKPSFEIILYVADQERSREFYSILLQKEPSLDVPGMTTFNLTKDFKLGLMPEKSIAKILADKTPNPSSANGTPRCELYIPCTNPQEDFERAIKAGAKEISPVQDRDWGHKVGYVSDPDGHVIAFAGRIGGAAAETAESIEELFEIAASKYAIATTEEGSKTMAWSELPETEKEKIQLYFTDEKETGFSFYKRDDNNWTALTTHQLFGKKEGEFCCFPLHEIKSFNTEEVTDENALPVISVVTAFDLFGFECESNATAEQISNVLTLFHDHWTALQNVEE